MMLLKCEACGGNEIKKAGENMYVCAYCGSTYLMDEHDNIVSRHLTEEDTVKIIAESTKLHQEEKYSEELKLLIRAIEMDENNASIMINLGRCYRCMGYPDKALTFYKRSIELNPFQGVAYTNIGVIYTLREEYKKAAEYFEKGLAMIDKAEFDYWQAYANYAVSVARLGDHKRAERIIREAEAHGYKRGVELRKMAGIKSSVFSKITSLFS